MLCAVSGKNNTLPPILVHMSRAEVAVEMVLDRTCGKKYAWLHPRKLVTDKKSSGLENSYLTYQVELADKLTIRC